MKENEMIGLSQQLKKGVAIILSSFTALFIVSPGGANVILLSEQNQVTLKENSIAKIISPMITLSVDKKGSRIDILAILPRNSNDIFDIERWIKDKFGTFQILRNSEFKYVVSSNPKALKVFKEIGLSQSAKIWINQTGESEGGRVRIMFVDYKKYL